MTATKIPFRKPKAEWTPDELAAKRAYDARKARESRARRRVAKVKKQIAVEGWTRDSAFQYLRRQGFGTYPETEAWLEIIWRKYCEYRRSFVDSQMPGYFEFRDKEDSTYVNGACTILWPEEVWDCIFGEIAAGVLAPNTATKLHVVRELAKALGHRDVQEGDTYRSFFSSVWSVWATKGFPMFNRVDPNKLTPGMQPDWNGDIVRDGYVFDADADKPIDVSQLRPFSPLIAEVNF